MKKLAALLLCLMLMMPSALAEIEWPATLTTGQARLRNYVDTVNLNLSQLGGSVIDMKYELYATFASLGMDGADAPDTVEMYFLLGEAGLHSLTLRICDADKFETVAAACLSASSSAISVDSARELTGKYAAIMRQDQANADAMTHSFEEALRRGQRRLFDPFSLLGDFGMMPKTMLTEFPAPTEGETTNPTPAPQSELVDAIDAAKLQAERKRNALQAQLRAAIAEERYEDAAKLRDELKTLD